MKKSIFALSAILLSQINLAHATEGFVDISPDLSQMEGSMNVNSLENADYISSTYNATNNKVSFAGREGPLLFRCDVASDNSLHAAALIIHASLKKGSVLTVKRTGFTCTSLSSTINSRFQD